LTSKNLAAKIILGGQVMRKDADKMIREYLAKLGRKGGKARAARYDKATLSKWAKLGGRPPKKGKKNGN
jgi:hypothetical protein